MIVTALGCVALDGASSEGDVGGNLPRLRGGLELLASAARRPGAVLAFEALWVPDEDDEVLDGEELSTLKEANVEALEKKLEEGHMLDGEELSTLKEANVEALESNHGVPQRLRRAPAMASMLSLASPKSMRERSW